MSNKFYIKCALIACAILLSTQCFSSSIPLLEQVTNLHKGRMALFNEDQKEAEKLGLTFKKDTKVSDVSGKTTAIRGILNDTSKVSKTTYATPDQKKDVFKALIAGYFIHDSDYEAALDDMNLPKFRIVPDLSGADAQTKRHYHVIDLVQQIAHELVIGGHADQLDDYYLDLQNSSGIDRDTFEGLFYDTLADHAVGIAEYVRTKHVYPRNSVNYAPDVAQQDNIKKKLKLLPKKNFNTYLEQKYGVAATPVVTPAVSQSGTPVAAVVNAALPSKLATLAKADLVAYAKSKLEAAHTASKSLKDPGEWFVSLTDAKKEELKSNWTYGSQITPEILHDAIINLDNDYDPGEAKQKEIYPENTATYAQVVHYMKVTKEDLENIASILADASLSEYPRGKLTVSRELLQDKFNRLKARKIELKEQLKAGMLAAGKAEPMTDDDYLVYEKETLKRTFVSHKRPTPSNSKTLKFTSLYSAAG